MLSAFLLLIGHHIVRTPLVLEEEQKTRTQKLDTGPDNDNCV